MFSASFLLFHTYIRFSIHEIIVFLEASNNKRRPGRPSLKNGGKRKRCLTLRREDEKTEERKKKYQAINTVHKKEVRANETPEKRIERLSKDLQRKLDILKNESPDQRKQRLGIMRDYRYENRRNKKYGMFRIWDPKQGKFIWLSKSTKHYDPSRLRPLTCCRYINCMHQIELAKKFYEDEHWDSLSEFFKLLTVHF